MSDIIRQYGITKTQDGSNISYLFDDSSLLSMVEYKVAKNWDKGGFIPSEKLKYNGKLKIVYFAKEYKKLEDYIKYADIKSLYGIIGDYLQLFISVKENGFLNVDNFILDQDSLFVNESKRQAMMIYLPIDLNSIQECDTEKNIRTTLYNLLSKEFVRWDINIQKQFHMLIDFNIATQKVYRQYIGNESPGHHNPRKKRILILQTLDQNTPLKFTISLSNNETYIIGRKKEIVNGLIPNNPRISRRHCEISIKNNEYYIRDLESSNGTFVDGVHLNKQIKKIENKKMIRIANVNFVASLIEKD